MEQPSHSASEFDPRDARLRRVRLACAWFVILLGASGVAWELGRGQETLPDGGFPPLAPLSGLSFLTLGACLIGLSSRSQRALRRRLVLVGALVVVGVASVNLLGYSLGWDWDAEAWLSAHWAAWPDVGSERIPQLTSLAFWFAGIAIGLLTAPPERPFSRELAGICAEVVLALGLVFILSHLYDAPEGGQGPRALPVTPQGAVGILILGIGLAAAVGRGGPPLRHLSGPSIHARLLRAFLPVTMVIVCLVAWLTHVVVVVGGPSTGALFSALWAVLAIFLVSFLCTRSARTLGADIEKVEAELREGESLSRQHAAELKTLNATLEQRVAERTAALETHRDHLDAFFTISTSLQDPQNVEKTFDLVLRFCERLGYDIAMLSLVDPEAGVVRAVKAAGSMAQIVGQTVRSLEGDDILAVVVREGKTAVIPDSTLDPRCDQQAVADAGIRGQITVPLTSGKVVGTLQVASRNALNPSPQEVRTLETLASHAARALTGLLGLKEIQRLNRQLEERNLRLQQLADELNARMTSERQAHVALRESEERLQAILDNCTAVIFMKDPEGRYLLVNHHFETLFHVRRDQVLGKNDFDFFPKDMAETFRHNDLQVREANRPLMFEEVAPQDDGLHTFISIKFPLFGVKGAVYGICGISTDITDRKRDEERLHVQNRLLQEMAASERQAHEALKQAQSQLVHSEKLASLGTLVAGVAHEINNPLSYVSNNVAVLQRDVNSLGELVRLYHEAEPLVNEQRPALAGRLHELTGRIDLDYTLNNLEGLVTRSRDGLKRIQHIVKGLRDFARLDESDLHEVDLNAGIESTVNIIRGQAKKQQVALDLDLQPLPGVTCYPAKINQVVLNLVSNAIDACPPQGKVRIVTRPKPKGVEIQVDDTGSGIDPAIRARIFDPFFTTKPQGKGTGLGLSISYGIVHAHGGTIDFVSTPGQGTRFRVELPLKPPNDIALAMG